MSVTKGRFFAYLIYMDTLTGDLELIACTPRSIDRNDFNPNAELPYGCTTGHLYGAMTDFIEFLGFINQQWAHPLVGGESDMALQIR